MTPAQQQLTYSVLVVSADSRFDQFLANLLPTTQYVPIAYAKSNSQARQMLLERDYDFVIINAPLPDDFGTKLAIDVVTNSTRVALLLARTDVYTGVYYQIVRHGVMTLRKPVTPAIVSQSLDNMCAIRERLRKMEKKTLSVEEKIQEIRLVNRAKWALISQRGMTEEEAHRYIEKQAMDNCMTRSAIAHQILENEICGEPPKF